MIKKLKIIILLLLSLIVIICIYEVYISYNNLIQNPYTITTNQISNSINIAVISDLHDNQIGENNQKIIDEINNISPDIILVVGDMLNKDSQNSEVVINLMEELCQDYKVFYSWGNTEIDYIESGTSDLKKELEDAGVVVLHNEYGDVEVDDNIIRIGGMFDYAFGLKHNKYYKMDYEKEVIYDFLSEFENTDNYKIMMAHRPDSFIFNNATKDWDVDLVVSGHTHGGQVALPFLGGLYVADQGFFPQYCKGIFDLDDTKILITSGLGSGKQKVPRFNNKPEIVNLTLHN